MLQIVVIAPAYHIRLSFVPTPRYSEVLGVDNGSVNWLQYDRDIVQMVLSCFALSVIDHKVLIIHTINSPMSFRVGSQLLEHSWNYPGTSDKPVGHG